jgi:hypothetical protein
MADEQPGLLVGPTSYVTKFPAATTYIFGSTDETGISVESYEQNDTCDKYEQKNGQGEVIELVTHNPRSEITCLGEITSGTITAVVGKSFTFANLFLTYYGTPTPTGLSVINAIQTSKGRAKNQQIRVSATYYPLLVA